MVIKYSAPELIAIGEMVILRECISRVPNQIHHEMEPQYHQVYVPPTQDTIDSRQTSSSISADNFLQDFAQFQHNLDQSIQLNRDIKWQSQAIRTKQEEEQQQQKLTNSVAEFFKKAQQNFNPTVTESSQADSSSFRARRLSEVEAELLGQLKGQIHL